VIVAYNRRHKTEKGGYIRETKKSRCIEPQSKRRMRVEGGEKNCCEKGSVFPVSVKWGESSFSAGTIGGEINKILFGLSKE